MSEFYVSFSEKAQSKKHDVEFRSAGYNSAAVVEPDGGDDWGPIPDFPTWVRFADFELDLNAVILRRASERLKLQPQPARILVLLVSRASK